MLPRPMLNQIPNHPDACAPERSRFVETRGARIRVYEWGDEAAPAILCCHGFIDHGRGFDLLAPILAEQYRVVSMDARGHGESSRADSYVWGEDLSDIVYVLRDLGPGTHLIGHSKGGGQATDAATLMPGEVGKLVNLDGFGPPEDGFFRRPDIPDFESMTLADQCGLYLDEMRSPKRRLEWRPYATLDEIVARRGLQNPRLDPTWLRYFVYHAAVQLESGWRWKADPMIVGGGFGPFRPAWIAPGWATLEPTMLAVIGSVEDQWGPLPDDVLTKRLSYVPRFTRATIEGSGHFLHMEEPIQLGRLILDFLGER